MLIRQATRADLAAINGIYNDYVIRSTCTYQEQSETIADRAAWFDRHGTAHPVVVAELDGDIVGWGALSPFHPRSAYARTVEDSLYVRPDAHRRGVGRAILGDLVERAGMVGHRSVVALIDAEQPASLALHAKLDFAEVGRLRQVGFKFGRWLDVVYMQRML